MSNEPKIKLITYTKDVIDTLGVLWYGTRGIPHLNNDNDVDVDKIVELRKSNAQFNKDYDAVIEKILESDMPMTRHIWFLFECSNTPVAWREQLVRHQVGHIFWAQSSRITDLSHFEYFIPPAIYNNISAYKVYSELMWNVRDSYNQMMELGIKYEDAKFIMPESRMQKIYWSVNFSSLKMLISKRICWMAQSSTWLPVIEKVMDEIKEKVSPTIVNSVNKPPCNLESCRCPFEIDSYNRMYGNDPLPVCPIYHRFIHERGNLSSHQDEKYEGYRNTDDKYDDALKSFQSFEKVWNDKYVNYVTDYNDSFKV
jgi:thymidylate synthase ThyX